MFNGKIHYKWQFSIATLNYQRVRTCFFDHHQPPTRGVSWLIKDCGVLPWDKFRWEPSNTGGFGHQLRPALLTRCQQMTGRLGLAEKGCTKIQWTWPGRDPRILAPLPTHRGPGTPKLQRLLWHPAEEHGCHRRTAELGGFWWLTLQGSAGFMVIMN